MKQFFDFDNDAKLNQRPRLKDACIQLQQMALQLGHEAKLPTMIELRSQLGMSLSTINDAVRELERRGVLRCVNGVGIYVEKSPDKRFTGRLGLLLHAHSHTHPYLQNLLAGVHREAIEQGLQIVLLNEESAADESSCVDAVILYCHVTEALLLNLPQSLPQVLLFQHTSEFSCIVADDFEGGRLATQHLLDLGHRRIACVLSSDHDSVSRQRLAGYHSAHQDAGIAVQEDAIKFLQRSSVRNYREEGERAMAKWLEEDWNDLACTAIVAHNDETAIGVIRVLSDANYRVPLDVSVVGFDGTETSDLCTPRLTTVKVSLEKIGVRAVKVLVAQIQEGARSPAKITLPVQLKMGESTALRRIKAPNETSRYA